MFRVAAWYALAAWLVIQIAANTFPHLLLPDWSVRLVPAAEGGVQRTGDRVQIQAQLIDAATDSHL